MNKLTASICFILIQAIALGCSQQGFQAKNASSLASASVSPITNDSPPVITPDFDCLDDPQFNVCLIYKNPVVANNGPIKLDQLKLSSDLSHLQTYGVNITGTDSSGYLENKNVKVVITSGNRVQRTSNGDWKFEYKDNDINRSVAQTTIYYAINNTIDFLIDRGGNPTKDLQLPVDAVDTSISNNAFYNVADKKISIGVLKDSKNVTRQELALSTEVIIHEYGHAAMFAASNNAIANLSGTTHETCGSKNDGLCCKSAIGCTSAIGEGVGDILANLIYPESTAIGNALTNNLDGLNSAGVVRNADLQTDLTSAEAYSTPSSSYRGEIHILGIVYASAWRIAWLEAKKEGLTREIEEIFLEHLSGLTGRDTFQTALDKIIVIDDTFYDSKHKQKFIDAFKKKGIDPTN